MLSRDIVAQLVSRLPLYTDKFTTNASVSSMVRSGTTVTVTTPSAHGFIINKAVTIINAITPISITSLTRSTTTGTLVTADDHDITTPFLDNDKLTITISAANEANFNGTFNILSVPNRQTITFSMDDSGATTATGSPILEDGASCLQSYNGTFEITSVPTATSFTYEVPSSVINQPIGSSIEARAMPRIAGIISGERALEAYTRHEADELWMFVALSPVAASKDRQILSDATDNRQRSGWFRQQIIQGTSIYVFFPTSNEIAARKARDDAEDLFQPICKSILFQRFDCRLTLGKYNPLYFSGHDMFSYNTAVYVHEYNFEQVADINFADTSGYDEDVAFRDITLNIAVDPGGRVDLLTADIDLDDESL